ncbi:probable E3 ubiquitin-protein ligase RHY1A [Magnolia sinica]|uniref:probable E3 ubiquitin-protein ligase RHY1A n=1 Tax=Magnolia sinica TaxID=86752 RepID=UPI002657BDA5|nr:probable E3 ubiquitin-protein ligase RHY1A [Magnolia sinica]
MAGMLPGVECARRRRFHQGGSDPPVGVKKGGTRRSSFCLYTSSRDSHLNYNTWHRSATTQSFKAEKLGDIAREAKERLDERLRSQRNSEITRHNSTGSMRSTYEDGGGSFGSAIMSSLHKEIFGSKKKTSKRFIWAKLGWKASEQDECVVCLERFNTGELLVHLPCAHRFHSRCLVPWLETNTHCPCCRTEILS